MSMEQYLEWVESLRGLKPAARLEQVVRHYPHGAPMEAVRTLMNGLSGQRLDRLVSPLKRAGRVRFVYLVDTTCALEEDERVRQAQRDAACERVRQWKAEGRTVRHGTRDQKLLQWVEPGR